MLKRGGNVRAHNPYLHAARLRRSTGKRLVKFLTRRNSSGLCAPPTRNTETVKNHPRRVGAIKRVKVNTGNTVIQEVVTLFQREVNADAPDHSLPLT
jgi:hypothetical protein